MSSTDRQDARTGFMAPPGQVADWRMVVLADAAVEAGVLDALPGSPADVAERLGLDARAVRVVLAALREWDVVDVDEGSDRYRPGPAAVAGEEADSVRQQARSIRRWSAALTERLRGEVPEPDGARSPEQRETWMRALAANARKAAPTVADQALRRFPDARRVLDVAGGHGEYGMEFARRDLKVTMQDQPDMIDIVGRWPSLRDSGVRLFPGDVFEQLPDDTFDLVVVTGFTHTQPGERVANLLQRLHAATAPDGGIAIGTLLREQRPAGPIFAVQMLIGAGGGDTHARQDYETWLHAAGYGGIELADVNGRSLILAAADASA